jgi:hypothetical protein
MPKSKGRKTKASRRPYVPPPKTKKKPKASSPKWYAGLTIGLMLFGVGIIVLNYMGMIPGAGGQTYAVFLWVGLGVISAGFIAATRLR